MGNRRRLAGIRARAERRRRYAAFLERRIAWQLAEDDWPVAAELAEVLEPAARATLRQAGAGVSYAGLGFEWSRDWTREAPIRTAEAAGARPQTERQRQAAARRRPAAAPAPAMPPTVYIGESARLALELAASAARSAPAPVASGGVYYWPAPPPPPLLRPYGMPVHLSLSGAFGPGALIVALRRGYRG